MKEKKVIDFTEQLGKTPNDHEIIRSLLRPRNREIDSTLLRKIFGSLPLIAIIIGSLVIRIISTGKSEGFIHPDEVFQSLEMVHFRIFGEFGYGQTIPWEFNESFEYGGARSWFFVFILAGIYRFFMLFGVTDPIFLITAARFFLSLSSMITVVVAYKFGKEMFNKQVGLLSAFLCGFWWFFPYWASRTMTDSLSSDMLFLSMFLAYKITRQKDNTKQFLLGIFSGIFVGVAFMLRFPSGLMGLPLIIMLLTWSIIQVRKMNQDKENQYTKKEFAIQFIPGAAFLFGAILMIIAQGIMDYYTWGEFLQSPINFFLYNIVEGMSSIHGTSAWYRYITGFYYDFANIYIIIFVFFWAIGLIFNKKWKSKAYYIGIFLFWIILFSALAHKEFRFIFAILPFSMILVANGIDKVVKFVKSKSIRIALLGTFTLFFFTSSIAMATVHNEWMWDYGSGICNAMYWTGQQDNVERVVVFETVWYTGGYAYLDKDVPIYFLKVFDVNYVTGTLNNSIYRALYSDPGTYIIIRDFELFFMEAIILSCGLHLIHVEYDNPTAYVYAH